MAKYRVYADYTVSKLIGEFEAENEEEAKEKAIDVADSQICLCNHCSREFEDYPMLNENSFEAEQI